MEERNRITIHYSAPAEKKYHWGVVYDKSKFVRNKEAAGVKEVWIWKNDDGVLCAAW